MPCQSCLSQCPIGKTQRVVYFLGRWILLQDSLVERDGPLMVTTSLRETSLTKECGWMCRICLSEMIQSFLRLFQS